MRLTALVIGALAVTGAVFACGSDDASTNGANGDSPDGRAPDAPGDAPRNTRGDAPPPIGATPAAGGGVCCPLQSPCSPNYKGGWAPSAEECPYDNTYDGRFDKRTDEHGCEYWSSNFGAGSFCCGCATPQDAGDDADADADAN